MSSQKPEYALPRGGNEVERFYAVHPITLFGANFWIVICRLNHQHNLIVRDIGFLLHPVIRQKFSPISRIADVGTGTGIWLQELAGSTEVTSSTQLDGFDISDAQFPDKSQLSPNMTFHVANAKEPFPVEFHGKFDVVNVRWVVVGMRPEDYDPVTRNLMDLLKPGGALQWAEADLQAVKNVMHEVPTARVDTFQATMRDFAVQVGPHITFAVANLERVFRERGLNDVVDFVTSSDRLPEARVPWSKHVIETWGTTMAFLARTIGEGYSESDIQEKKRLMLEETESGAYVRIDHHVFVGFKPT